MVRAYTAMHYSSNGVEKSVPIVAKARHNILLVVEAFVHLMK